jgi:hypothetical protein
VWNLGRVGSWAEYQVLGVRDSPNEATRAECDIGRPALFVQKLVAN